MNPSMSVHVRYYGLEPEITYGYETDGSGYCNQKGGQDRFNKSRLGGEIHSEKAVDAMGIDLLSAGFCRRLQ